jgi:hypothetical protein
MSLIESGPVPDASCEGEAADGEPEVETVCAVEEGFCSRERSAESIGSVSMESGVSPSGRLKREGGGGVAWLGEVAILDNVAGVMIWLYSSEINAGTACSVTSWFEVEGSISIDADDWWWFEDEDWGKL